MQPDEAMLSMLKITPTALLLALVSFIPAQAAESARYAEGKFEKGELRYVDGLPLLTVEGTPREIGRQQGALTRDIAQKLVDYPKELLSVIGQQGQYATLIDRSRSLVGQIPKDYQRKQYEPGREKLRGKRCTEYY